MTSSRQRHSKAMTARGTRSLWIVTAIVCAALVTIVLVEGHRDLAQLKREAESRVTHATELLHKTLTRALGEVALTLEDLRLAIEVHDRGPIPLQQSMLTHQLTTNSPICRSSIRCWSLTSRDGPYKR